jgi:hypothetical protein
METSVQPKRQGNSRSAIDIDEPNSTTNSLEKELHSKYHRNRRNILAKAGLFGISVLFNLGAQTYQALYRC